MKVEENRKPMKVALFSLLAVKEADLPYENLTQPETAKLEYFNLLESHGLITTYQLFKEMGDLIEKAVALP
ncbi:hypothetical protein KEJ47_08835 [Candidatus Bathyarchaeota archaeon]|nr:hypothetical protein [Candidatus Bathyarchaeota archaeon]